MDLSSGGGTLVSVCCLPKQQQANVATSFTDLWGTGGRLLLLLKQHEKSGWSVTATAHKCHLQLQFPRQWGMSLGRQGVWWGTPWAKQLNDLQRPTSWNTTQFSTLVQVWAPEPTAETWGRFSPWLFRGCWGRGQACVLLCRNTKCSFAVYTLCLGSSVNGNCCASTGQTVLDFPFSFLMHWNPSVYGDVHADFFSFNSENNEVKMVFPKKFCSQRTLLRVNQIYFLCYRDYIILYFRGLFARTGRFAT